MEPAQVISFETQRLREREAAAEALRARYTQGGRAMRTPGWQRALVAGSLLFAAGSVGYLAKTAYPAQWAVAMGVARTAPERLIPLLDCDVAARLGYVNIPRGSPAYSRYRDADGDGLACEPYLRAGR